MRAAIHTSWTHDVLPEHAHTKYTSAVPHARPAQGHRLPLQALEAPTPVSHPTSGLVVPLHLVSWSQMALLREAQRRRSPSSSLRPDKVLESSREAAPRLRNVGETGGGARSQTPDSQLRPRNTRGAWTGMSVNVSLPHAGDTLRTCAYLCVGGPAWSPLSESEPAGSSDSPWIKVGWAWGVTPLALQAASCPWAARKLRARRREVTRVRALGGSALWFPVPPGVPSPPRPPPSPPRLRPAARRLRGA